MKKNVTIICDLQFGSTGKGAAAGYTALMEEPDTVVTAWSPNAGHTFVDYEGRKFVHRALANGIVSPKLKTIMVAPGTVLDVDRLIIELTECHEYVKDAVLVIHENAALLKEDHVRTEEKTMTGIGSTKKGSGAALIGKLSRQVDVDITTGQFREFLEQILKGYVRKVDVVDTRKWLAYLDCSDKIVVEGAQGFSLGINSGFYPYCTSRECSPAQIMSDTLINARKVDRVIGVMRTFPIRVANRYDEEGNMIGYSGPGYVDQTELNWGDLGFKPEKTTVTKLERRIFSFSDVQTLQALEICAPDEIWLSFCDYLDDDEAQKLKEKINHMYRTVHGDKINPVKYMSFGPSCADVVKQS